MAGQAGVQNESIVTWTPVVVTTMFSFLQGCGFFVFFLLQRWRYRRMKCYDLYEARMYKRRHRSPPPFGKDPSTSPRNGKTKLHSLIEGCKNAIQGVYAWATAAYRVDNDELLRCVGLDSYMFLRFLRLGFRMSGFGSLLGISILIPLYYTGKQIDPESQHFNSITISHVSQGSRRLIGTAICWYLFVAFVLRELWLEWKHYAQRRYDFLARGDVDTERDYRYAVIAENVPPKLQSNWEIRKYFERMFPGKVRQVNVCLETSKLDGLVYERLQLLQLYEVAEAKVHAYPDKSRPTVRVPKQEQEEHNGKSKVDALVYYHQKIEALNEQIDQERQKLHDFVDARNLANLSSMKSNMNGGKFVSNLAKSIPLSLCIPSAASYGTTNTSGGAAVAVGAKVKDSLSTVAETGVKVTHTLRGVSIRSPKKQTASAGDCTQPNSECSIIEGNVDEENVNPNSALEPSSPDRKEPCPTPQIPTTSTVTATTPSTTTNTTSTRNTASTYQKNKTTSTAFITFTSLRAKQCAVQCELNGKVDNLDLSPAPEPNAVIWRNITIPASTQRLSQMQVSGFWTAGTLFWAIPMTIVNSLANLDSIMMSIGLGHYVNPNGFMYGFVSGLVPVLSLQLLMWLLPKLIEASAYYIIRKKSQPDIESYTFYWHQLYQFANLWFILIGGSLFNQIHVLLKNPSELIALVTAAMTGSSIFFVDMIVWNTFANLGMELSLLPAYGMTLVRNLIQPEATRTQRMMDAAKEPESIKWGDTLPPMVFVYLLALVYMHMVPIMEVFAAVYFAGAYVVWKHQCLHVYAQHVEGGGVIWKELFRFLMGCLYMAELVFIGMMGIKSGGVLFAMGFIPLGCTALVHRILCRTVIAPLENLALAVAATIDIEEGELEVTEEDYLRGFTVAVERQLYGQPVLKSDVKDRDPMPYRRHEVEEVRQYPPVEEDPVEEDRASNADSLAGFQDCQSFLEYP